jgi:hypothetical protein
MSHKSIENYVLARVMQTCAKSFSFSKRTFLFRSLFYKKIIKKTVRCEKADKKVRFFSVSEASVRQFPHKQAEEYRIQGN